MMREICPCCAYPTLEKRSYDEICILCDWEDGSYNELDPEKIDGGPNGDYSLAGARRNFEAHLTMYRKKTKDLTPAVIEKKRMLMVAYETLNINNEETETIKWDKIVKLEQSLNLQG
ncbi:CPCC family cysteine-rich protein [Planococcus sp. APC 3906]|uniref:CPCC family cysteine-rich protein n=1 Tax=Planococcus sp. APC 3906 TaxID=3035194 RepID=UPI0025B5AB7E|nr:CPCC family cysteine-rich protein [Planococcus sp. APC 3906]MDN3451079.1 CPCC family cysteine-rich protein [Planococcus sp. APC 3906]